MHNLNGKDFKSSTYSAYVIQNTIKVGMPYVSWLNITCASSFSCLCDWCVHVLKTPTHPSLPACAFGSALSCLAPPTSSSSPTHCLKKKNSNRRRLEELLRNYDQTLKSLQAAQDKVLAQFCFPVGSSYRPVGTRESGPRLYALCRAAQNRYFCRTDGSVTVHHIPPPPSIDG